MWNISTRNKLYIRINSKIVYVFSLSIFLILMFLINYQKLNVPYIVFIAISVLVGFVCDKEDIITFCVCIIPMLNMFQSKYVLLILMIIYFLKFNNNVKFSQHFLPVILMITWELFHCYVYDFSVSEWLRSFAELLFCGFLLCCTSINSDFNLKKLSRSLSITTMFSCILLLLMQLREHNWQVVLLFQGYFRFGSGINIETFSVNYNPNSLGFLCFLSIMVSVLLIQKKEHSEFEYISIIVLIIFGLLTMSRKFILAGALFVFLICASSKKIFKIKYLIGITVIGLITYFIIKKLFPELIDLIVARFQVDDISNGRNDLFAFYINHIISSVYYFFVGIGLQGYATRIYALYGAEQNIPHNGLLELWVVWGLPGVIMFVSFIYCIIQRARQINKNIKFLNYLPLIIILFSSMGSQLISISYTILSFAVSYLCLINNLDNSTLICANGSLGNDNILE